MTTLLIPQRLSAGDIPLLWMHLSLAHNDYKQTASSSQILLLHGAYSVRFLFQAGWLLPRTVKGVDCRESHCTPNGEKKHGIKKEGDASVYYRHHCLKFDLKGLWKWMEQTCEAESVCAGHEN